MTVSGKNTCPTQSGKRSQVSVWNDTKGGCKLVARLCMQGACLNSIASGKAPPERSALKPYWGKPAVRFLEGVMETSASFEARLAP